MMVLKGKEDQGGRRKNKVKETHASGASLKDVSSKETPNPNWRESEMLVKLGTAA
jgi:hypothetical protein